MNRKSKGVYFQIVAGSADKSDKQAQVRYSDEVEIHPKYIRNTLAAYDIALIKVINHIICYTALRLLNMCV